MYRSKVLGLSNDISFWSIKINQMYINIKVHILFIF